MAITDSLVNDFGAGVEYLGADFNFTPYHRLQHHISIPDARDKLAAGLQYYLGDRAKWLPAYDEVADWLSDNQGKGLLCVGLYGLGKTLICQYILPVIIHRYTNKVPNCYTAIEMTRQIDDILKKSLVFIDDVGTEPIEINTYGVRRVPFNELCDACERRGSLLVLNTNLRTDMERLKEDSPAGRRGDPDPRRSPSFEERYGLRTLDRLRALTRLVVFSGQSMRG